MKLKLRITNQSNNNIQISLEPTGDFQNLSKNDELVLELEKIKDGEYLDLLIYDNELMFAENNNVHVDWVEDSKA